MSTRKAPTPDNYNLMQACFCTGACRVAPFTCSGKAPSSAIDRYKMVIEEQSMPAKPAPMGWQCPQCRVIHAPTVLACHCAAFKQGATA